MPHAVAHFVIAVAACFLVWRVYRRVRCEVGRQLYRPLLVIYRIIIYSGLTAGIVFFSRNQASLLEALGIGALVGIPLAFLGLALTKFDTTSEGHVYTPNPYVGVILILLLVGRIVYRASTFSVSQLNDDISHPQAHQLARSPLTFFLIEVLASYYLTYYVGILIRGREHCAKSENGGEEISPNAPPAS